MLCLFGRFQSRMAPKFCFGWFCLFIYNTNFLKSPGQLTGRVSPVLVLPTRFFTEPCSSSLSLVFPVNRRVGLTRGDALRAPRDAEPQGAHSQAAPLCGTWQLLGSPGKTRSLGYACNSQEELSLRKSIISLFTGSSPWLTLRHVRIPFLLNLCLTV